MLPLSLSYDHRVIDGALAARFATHLVGRARRPAAGAAVSSSRSRSPTSATSSDVPVIEVLVEPGDEVAAEDPLVTLESDKATMDVPSPAAGTVTELQVEVGDKVSEGIADPHAREAVDGAAGAPRRPRRRAGRGAAEPRRRRAAGVPTADVDAPTWSCSAPGPGGYTAAFRAADLGLKVVLVERYARSAASA